MTETPTVVHHHDSYGVIDEPPTTPINSGPSWHSYLTLNSGCVLREGSRYFPCRALRKKP